MKQQEFVDSIEATYGDALSLVRKKNDDYAGKDNTDPFANFRSAEHVDVDLKRAILVRVMDKISRISNILDDDPSVKEERIDDTILDACNYLSILKAKLEDER